MDPYSHTPAHTGARQPGLTGQVKEDILCRFGELGVSARQGRIVFAPRLLRRQEFLTAPASFDYFGLDGAPRRLTLKAGSLAFTYCQVPVIYTVEKPAGITIAYANGKTEKTNELTLSAAVSQALLNHTGEVSCLEVGLGKE